MNPNFPHNESPQVLARKTMNQIEAIFPMSPIQEGILFHAVEDESRPMYVVQVVVKLRGDIRGDRLEAAWNTILARHGGLRTAFVWRKVTRPMQVVVRELKLQVTEHHMNSAALVNWLEEDRLVPFVLTRAPLMRVNLVHVEDQHVLVWTHHHLLLDGWSLAMVLQQVLEAAGAENDNLNFLGHPPQFKDYLEWLDAKPRGMARAFLAPWYSGRVVGGMHRCPS